MSIDKAISIKCTGAKNLALEDLNILQGNLKDLSEENYNKLKREILNHGFSEPPSVWFNEGKWWLLNGTQRTRVLTGMKAEGYFIPPIPVSIIEADDITQAKEKVLALTSQYGEITDTGLYEFMNESGIDLSYLDDLRFPEIDLDEWREEYTDDSASVAGEEDEVPEPPKIPRTKLGDLIEIGEHRLLCGDSTDKAQVEKLMNGQKADMVFTDPPYGIDEQTDRAFAAPSREAKGNTFAPIIGDKDTSTAIKTWNLIQELKPRYQIYWGANHFASEIDSSPSWIVWDKREEDKESDFNSDCELAWCKGHNKSVRIFRHKWKGMIKASEHGEGRVHPTQKPIALAEWCYENYGNPFSVLDLFGGSGSTLVACEKTKRKCFMIEIDPHYVDVIISRYCKFVGTNKVRINGNEVEWELPIE